MIINSDTALKQIFFIFTEKEAQAKNKNNHVAK